MDEYIPGWNKPLAYAVYARTSDPNNGLTLYGTEKLAESALNNIRVTMYQNKGLNDWGEDGGDVIPITFKINDLYQAINTFKVYPVKLILAWCKLNGWILPPLDVEWPPVITATDEATIISKNGRAELIYNDEIIEMKGDNHGNNGEYEEHGEHGEHEEYGETKTSETVRINNNEYDREDSGEELRNNESPSGDVEITCGTSGQSERTGTEEPSEAVGTSESTESTELTVGGGSGQIRGSGQDNDSESRTEGTIQSSGNSREGKPTGNCEAYGSTIRNIWSSMYR